MTLVILKLIVPVLAQCILFHDYLHMQFVFIQINEWLKQQSRYLMGCHFEYTFSVAHQ